MTIQDTDILDFEKFNNAMQAYEEKNKDRAKTLISVPQGNFRESVEALFETCKKYLHGDYILQAIYEDIEKLPSHVYGLVYADYYETEEINEEGFLEVFKNDAHILDKKLKESGLPLDYYFIMPYYTKLDKSSALYNNHIILTHELEEK